jgi:Domain of unknown function (DUF4062)
MDKRYQVFVSSTYADLKEERQHIIQALMEMDCIPAGMELFPAADEEQWEFIKKVINDCDYYLLLIGGRYGSITPDGGSYTEKEFNYAIEKGLKVVAFVHQNPGNIQSSKSETNSDSRDKLALFREKVTKGRLVKFWNNAEELPGLVALSLTKTIKMYPAIGWVRANQVSNEELLTELNQLRKENKKIIKEKSQIIMQPQTIDTEDIVSLSTMFEIHGKYKISDQKDTERAWSIQLSWRELFIIIAPSLSRHPIDSEVEGILMRDIKKRKKQLGDSPSIDDQIFQTIRIQLQAYGLVKTSLLVRKNWRNCLEWSLTEKGEKFMIESRIVKNIDSEK